ncbi:FecR family protein [Chitinophaga rhizophila]|uniref:FecR domain-containing protein n=1 Tax=Chitinophaga rhizophila TaxID=2866212 RepID=A0ABS7GLV7_9BACT|nr:FecR domain-containing protein [Chitinophaga rhizophila]MBW8688381.1 FecR domain-containing protein [Chitinophaga rhizophila]
MKYDQEYIYTLLLRKQLGELSEVEDQLLQKVMETDEQVRKCWHEQEQAILYTDNAFLDDLRIEHDWCKIAAILSPKPRHLKVYHYVKRHSAAAAVLAAMTALAGGWYAFKHYYSAAVPATTLRQVAAKQPAKTPAANTANVSHTSPSDTLTTIRLPDNQSLRPSVADTGSHPAISVKRITHDTIYQSSTIEWNTLTVPPKTDYRIELSDGTEVHLNASSTLRFPFIFPGRTREVYLEGEAYFTVAHNPKQPFIVHTGTTSVIALGTAFNVNSYDNNLITTSLVTGSVVTDVGDSLDVTLKPGFEAIYKPGERFKVKRFDENVTLGWRDGIFRFHNKTLEEVAPVLKRWFGLKVAFAANSIAGIHFSGDLDKDKAVNLFLDELCWEKGLDYKIYDGTIHFSMRKESRATN